MSTRAAIVTGGSSGIGKAMARTLVEEGYGLTLVARNRARLEAVAAELAAGGAEVQAVPADVSDDDAIVRIVEEHRARFGRLDVLVNCAGGGEAGVSLAAMPTELLDAHLALNLRPAFLTIRAAMPMLTAAGAEHGKALVVNVGSMAGVRPGPGISFYSAAKAGLNAMTESVQLEELAAGIQFTHFSPGMTATGLSEWMADAGIPSTEMVQPNDLAEGLRFLLRTSPNCRVRGIEFTPPKQEEFIATVVAYQQRQHPESKTAE